MEYNEKKSLEIRPVLVKLLQGFLTHENKKQWETLLIHQDYVRNYFKFLGLYVHLNREDGFAFLKTSPDDSLKLTDEDLDLEMHENEVLRDSEGDYKEASLIRKMPLSFEVSLLLVLLREAIEQYDVKVSDDYRLILKKQDIYEMLKTFYQSTYQSGGDETKILRKFDALIVKICSMGFMKELKLNSGVYEVKRTIKAFMNPTQLKVIKEKMKIYLEQH